MIEKLIFIVLVLYIGSVLGKGICNDCMKFTECKAASDHANLKRDNDTQQLFSRAYCGNEYENGGTIYKVCCSLFPPLNPRKISLNSRSRIDKEHLLPESCGSILGNRIVGGKYANLYEFPWMVLIAYGEESSPRFDCGGTIINSKYVLTAAHCVKKNILFVRIGEFDYSSDEDCEYGPGVAPICENHIQEVSVEMAIPHSNYRRHPPLNDIALLRVKGEIDFSFDNVEPICLPITPELRNTFLDSKTGTVAGWGVTETHRSATKLMKVEIPLKSNADCKMYYRDMLSNRWNKTMEIMKNQFCGGELGKDSCNGDSGGPFMIKESYKQVNRYVQYGIVSHGPRKCGSDRPGFYTDITKYVDWILDNITD